MFSDNGRGPRPLTYGALALDRERVRLAAARARLGQWLRKWRLTALLGIGGTASVYAAQHRNGARVALKIMHPEFASDPERCARFQREGYAANLVEHPGVVSIHDDGVDEHGQPFLVMELLRGDSLQSLLGAAPAGLPLESVLRWARALLEILECAHSKSVLHRDIKPSNLFLDEQGRLRILDFGLAGGAAFLESCSAVTVSGSIQGTPAFMPPEQARGDWTAVDARSDLWATGATLFALLSGEHVHLAGSSQEQLGMAMVVSPRSLRAVKPRLPDEVIRFVDRALEFEPARRFRSAGEMAAVCRELEPLARTGRENVGRASSLGDTLASDRAVVTSLPDQRLDTQRTATLSVDRPAIRPRSRHFARHRRFAGGLALVATTAVVITAMRGSEREHAPRALTTSMVTAALAPTFSFASERAGTVPERGSLRRETAVPREHDEGGRRSTLAEAVPKLERAPGRPAPVSRAPASSSARAAERTAPKVEIPPSSSSVRSVGRPGAEVPASSSSVRLVDRPELRERK